MNKIFLGLGILASSMAMVSCSQDDFDSSVNNPSDDGSRFYTQLTISLPTTGSRASDITNPVGEEVGQDGENKINNMSIILMDKYTQGTSQYYKYVTTTDVTTILTQTSTKPTYQAVFNGKEIKDYYDATAGQENRKLWMFVIANSGKMSISSDFDPAESVFETSMFLDYSESRSLLMSGVPYQVSLPDTKEELMKYDNKSRPYNLTSNGAVEVERSIARFDFKSTNNNIYEIKDNNKNVIGKIELLDMAVVNERKSAYHFGRSSADGQNDNFKFELVAKNTSNTFVVSPKADDLTKRNFYSKFDADVKTATGINQESGYLWQNIADLTSNDNDDSWNQPNTFGDYKIWRYVNENTIPGTDDQTYGNSTGVIFRGTIRNTDGTGIPGYGAPALYLFQNVLYGDFANLLNEAKAVDSDGNSTNPVLKYYFEQTWGDVNSADEKTITGTAPAKNGFTVYRNTGSISDPVYYTYYYYWNRHQDNNQANVMGEMEFAVVRNNVYKLAVTSINRFGHTTDDDDDPDPVDPDNPDEKEDIYFKVDVKVLPWTVRVNNIEF